MSVHLGICTALFNGLCDSSLLAAGPIEQVSPANKFPQAAFALYNAPGFAWNPSGTGLAMEAFDFPILMLDNVTAPAAAQRAAHNAQQVYTWRYKAKHLLLFNLKLSVPSGDSSLSHHKALNKPLGSMSASPRLPAASHSLSPVGCSVYRLKKGSCAVQS